jgi:omega-6 fatty acid desaturase (delta-12 desaturase)
LCVSRHPLNIALALLTVFFAGMCLRPFFRAPKKHFEALLSPLLVGALAAATGALGHFDVFVFSWLVPMAVAASLGAYLFYAQHNFPHAHVLPREQWTYASAALDASSYMEMGPVMSWFTANIGYHHVHHLNAAIPFYRLPEAMAELPELQSPGRTSLWPRDVLACFRLKLIDPQTTTLTGFGASSLSPLGESVGQSNPS